MVRVTGMTVAAPVFYLSIRRNGHTVRARAVDD
jgi:hypothetical protein